METAQGTPAVPGPMSYGGSQGGPRGYGGVPTGGMSPDIGGGELPNFDGTKKALMIMLVGFIIQLVGPFMAIGSNFVGNAISFAGTAIILLGMFMVFFAIKRGEIQIPDTTKMVNISIALLISGLVLYGVGFIFVLAGEEAMNEYDDADTDEERVEHIKDAADAQLFGTILTFTGRLLSFLAPALTMLGIRKVCFDEYQGKIMTKAIIAIILMVITLVTVVVSILVLRAEIYALDEDSSYEEIMDAYDAIVDALVAMCLGLLLMIIGYFFIMWATTTTYHGLKQVEGEHKRRMAGW